MASASSTFCPSLTSSMSTSSTLLDDEHISSYFSDDSEDSDSDSDSDEYDSDALEDEELPPVRLVHRADSKSSYINDNIFLDDMDLNKGVADTANLDDSDYLSYRRRGLNPTNLSSSVSKFSSLPRLTMPPSLYSTKSTFTNTSIEIIDAPSDSPSSGSSLPSFASPSSYQLTRTSRLDHNEDVDQRFNRALAFASRPRRHRRDRSLPSHADCGEESSEEENIAPSRSHTISPPHARASFLPQKLVDILYSNS